MVELSGGTTKPLQYEDIVMKAFEIFPDEFALRGYPQHPDSSDIHKPLYGPLKRDGFVRSANKTFSLTPLGVERGRSLIKRAGSALVDDRESDRMTRDVEQEVRRMLGSAAYRLYSEQRPDRILDTDFFSFVGCTVRTPRNDLLGRISTTEKAIEAARKLGQPDKASADALKRTWDLLRTKFKSLMPAQHGGGANGKKQANVRS
jgi:hypothetical protein